VAERSHQLRAGTRAKLGFAVAQVIAPLAAATATVLAAFTSTSSWAVVPSAVATVASSLLAAFGFREIWVERQRLRYELGLEIVNFAQGYGAYRTGTEAARVDGLMSKVGEIARTSGVLAS